jgi:histone H1/5
MSKTVKATSKPATAVVAAKKQQKKAPAFRQLIVEAIEKLADRSGSSRQAIIKYVMANNAATAVDERQASKRVTLSLKAGIKQGWLEQAKGVGASGSFKLGSTSSRPLSSKKITVSKVAAKKTKQPKTIVMPSKLATKKSSVAPAALAKKSTTVATAAVVVVTTPLSNKSTKKSAKAVAKKKKPAPAKASPPAKRGGVSARRPVAPVASTAKKPAGKSKQ